MDRTTLFNTSELVISSLEEGVAFLGLVEYICDLSVARLESEFGYNMPPNIRINGGAKPSMREMSNYSQEQLNEIKLLNAHIDLFVRTCIMGISQDTYSNGITDINIGCFVFNKRTVLISFETY